MENHTVNSYDNELNQLRISVINMANLVKDLIFIAKQAIQDPSKSFTEIADSTDKKINYFDAQAEHLAVQVIALRQPMAIDLRQVIAALKLAVILERMGDLAKKISHRIEYLPIVLNPILVDLIHNIIINLETLMTAAIDAYDRLDDPLAIEVSKQDAVIDELYCQIMELLQKEMVNKPKESKALINIVLIARNFERIGDYITKIAYITHYIITGKKTDI